MARDQTRENLSCPVCRDIFKDPVLLGCSHSFCRACVELWWEQRPSRECPVCKTCSQCEDPPRNQALRALSEAFSSAAASGKLCPAHSQSFSLFCLDEEELMCVVCLHAQKHANHRFRPLDEAAADHKRLLEESLKMLREKLEELRESHDGNESSYGDALLKVQHAKAQTGKVFEDLRGLLRQEEESRVAAMEEEVERQGREVGRKQVDLARDIQSLSEAIADTEEKLRAEDVDFLHQYKTISQRVQSLMLGYPEPGPRVEFDESKHLAELPFKVLDRMKTNISYTMISLDDLLLHDEDAQPIPFNTHQHTSQHN